MKKENAVCDDIYLVAKNAKCNPKLWGEPLVIEEIGEFYAVGVVLTKMMNDKTGQVEDFEAPIRLEWNDIEELPEDEGGA